MTKIAFMLAMSAAVLASCQKNEELPIVSENEVYTASVESFDAQTKTSMTQDRQVVWSQDDRLAIFQGSTLADEYKVADAGEGNTNATFILVTDNSEVNGDFSAGVEVPRNIAFYPYASGLSITASTIDDEGTSYKITGYELPETQYYAAGSFGNGAFPMTAVTSSMSDHNLKFRNLLGAMKLRLKGTQTVKSIKVEGKNSEKLSGAAVITAYATNLTPAITMSETAGTSVTLDCGDGVQLNESTATDFFIALPPVLFSQGFIVTVTDDASQTYTFSADVANTVLRSSILTMPAVVLGDEVAEDEEENTDSSIKVLDITFDKSTLTLAPSTSYSLITIVVPETADDKTLTWSSSDPVIATVDQSGVVTAVSDGTAFITAVAVGGAFKSCTVNVISLPVFATATADYVDEYGVNHGKGVAIGATVWAPVNCGYKAAVTDADGNVTDNGFPYGKLYQWGRKYGQGYSADSDSEPMTCPGPVSAVVGQDASMADYFFTGYGWIETPDYPMWNSGTEDSPVKTVNDPCPNGWRVPTYGELNALQTEYSEWTSKDNQIGLYFRGASVTVYDTAPLVKDKVQVFFPAAGFLGIICNASGRGNDSYDGHYWSSKPSSYDGAYGLSFGGSADMIGYSQACGCSVRCVQVIDEVAEL